MDYYKQVNRMLRWSRQEQLGFCFYLFDHNNDGFVCLQDMFNLFKELNDQDAVLREDVNKLINILKEKGRKMLTKDHISPSVYGIYNEYENYRAKEPMSEDLKQKLSRRFSKRDFQKLIESKQEPEFVALSDYLAQEKLV